MAEKLSKYRCQTPLIEGRVGGCRIVGSLSAKLERGSLLAGRIVGSLLPKLERVFICLRRCPKDKRSVAVGG